MAKILLVDDILTTGATLEEAAKTLKNVGAKSVYALTLCGSLENFGEWNKKIKMKNKKTVQP